MDKVDARRVFAVYASYDNMAPNTEDLIYISNVEALNDFLDVVNDGAEHWHIAVTEGFEGYKKFKSRSALIEIGSGVEVYDTKDDALKAFAV
jgi:hypothetical protein